MSDSPTPKPTPTPAKGEVKQKPDSAVQRSIFFGAVLDMSWQMAIVVLVPLIGGYELDSHLHIFPVLTITGFVLAMLGTFVIMKRMLKGAADKYNKGGDK